MTITNLCTDASEPGYYPDEDGIANPAASSLFVLEGDFGNARMAVEVKLADRWVELEDGNFNTQVARNLHLGPDTLLRLRLDKDVNDTSETSISANLN